MIAYTDENNNVCTCNLMSSVPEGIKGYVVQPPQDLLFRSMWVINNSKLTVDLTLLKENIHEKRRAKRDKAFEPNLKIIDKHSKGIPLKASEDVDTAISENASIKKLDDSLQKKIDKCKTEKAIRKVLSEGDL